MLQGKLQECKKQESKVQECKVQKFRTKTTQNKCKTFDFSKVKLQAFQDVLQL